MNFNNIRTVLVPVGADLFNLQEKPTPDTVVCGPGTRTVLKESRLVAKVFEKTAILITAGIAGRRYADVHMARVMADNLVAHGVGRQRICVKCALAFDTFWEMEEVAITLSSTFPKCQELIVFDRFLHINRTKRCLKHWLRRYDLGRIVVSLSPCESKMSDINRRGELVKYLLTYFGVWSKHRPIRQVMML